MNNSTNSKKRKSTTESLKAPYMSIDIKDNNIEDIEKDNFKQRSIRNLFKCDPSQLPIEYNESNEENKNSDKKVYMANHKAAIKTNSDDEEICFNSTVNSTTSQQQPQFQLNHKNIVNPPSVILVSTQSDMLIEKNNNDKKQINNYPLINNSTLAAPSEYNLYERPLSRRSSRESTSEQSAETSESSREDTPLPLGDELDNTNNQIVDAITINSTNHANTKNKTWVTERNNQDNVLQNYHILQNFSTNEENNEKIKQNNLPPDQSKINGQNTNKSILPYSASNLSSNSEEEENTKETKMLDRHQYERLQESPLPPAITTQFTTGQSSI